MKNPIPQITRDRNTTDEANAQGVNRR